MSAAPIKVLTEEEKEALAAAENMKQIARAKFGADLSGAGEAVDFLNKAKDRVQPGSALFLALEKALKEISTEIETQVAILQAKQTPAAPQKPILPVAGEVGAAKGVAGAEPQAEKPTTLAEAQQNLQTLRKDLEADKKVRFFDERGQEVKAAAKSGHAVTTSQSTPEDAEKLNGAMSDLYDQLRKRGLEVTSKEFSNEDGPNPYNYQIYVIAFPDEYKGNRNPLTMTDDEVEQAASLTEEAKKNGTFEPKPENTHCDAIAKFSGAAPDLGDVVKAVQGYKMELLKELTGKEIAHQVVVEDVGDEDTDLEPSAIPEQEREDEQDPLDFSQPPAKQEGKGIDLLGMVRRNREEKGGKEPGPLEKRLVKQREARSKSGGAEFGRY